MFSAVNSNLLNLTIFDAQRLAGYQRLGRILTSLMGPSEEIHDTISGSHGSFNQTIKGIELLKSCGVAISVNMVVSKLNKEYVQATAQLCKELRVKTFNATRATTPLNCPDFSPYALSLNELREYLRALSEAGKKFELPVGALNVYPMCAVKHLRETSMTVGKRCSAGVTVAVVSSRGNVRACTHLQESVGSLLTEDLPTLWNKMRSWRDGSLIPSICRECKALAVCGGGCRAEAQACYGELNARDPLINEEDIESAVSEYWLYQSERRHPIKFPSSVVVNPEIRWRSEAFGSACFLENRCVGLFNNDTTRLLFTDLFGKAHDIVELEKSVPKSFLAELMWKRVLIKTERR